MNYHYFQNYIYSMSPAAVLHLVADIGQIILENGGETSRAQETISIIGKELGMIETEGFAIPTGLIISVTDKRGKTYSLVRLIKTRTINLEKVTRINSLSYNIKRHKVTPEEIIKELNDITEIRHYKNILIVFFAGICAAFLTLFFGGGLIEFIISFLAGFVIKAFSILIGKTKFNDFFINLIGGAIATFIALMSVNIHLVQSPDKIIIGSIMLLVPGIAIVNAIRDVIAGDLVSGTARLIEALITAAAIAVGSGIVFKIWMMSFGGIF